MNSYSPWAGRTPIWKRYEEDPTFRSLVDQCQWLFDFAHTTPSELREAVMLAAIQWEYHTLRKNFIYPSDFGIEEEIVRGTLNRIKQSTEETN